MDELIETYFQHVLVKRTLSGIVNELSEENKFVLTTLGMPDGVLDFYFRENIYVKRKAKLVIGKTSWGNNVILDLDSNIVIRESDNCFLASTLHNFVWQLYVYDYLWKVMIKEARLGAYQKDKNYILYAHYLRENLLRIDPYLLEKDSLFFWGSLIEDIEFGIVG